MASRSSTWDSALLVRDRELAAGLGLSELSPNTPWSWRATVSAAPRVAWELVQF